MDMNSEVLHLIDEGYGFFTSWLNNILKEGTLHNILICYHSNHLFLLDLKRLPW